MIVFYGISDEEEKKEGKFHSNKSTISSRN